MFDSKCCRFSINSAANRVKRSDAGAESRTPDSTIMSRVL